MSDTIEIPWDRVTIQQEYRKCHNPICECAIPDLKSKRHGPYLYAYWKDKGKLKKKYIGKSMKEYNKKLHEKSLSEMSGNTWTHTQWKKYDFIILASKCGSEIAEKYIERVGLFGVQPDDKTYAIFGKKKPRQSSIDWGYRVVKKGIRREEGVIIKMREENNHTRVTQTPAFV